MIEFTGERVIPGEVNQDLWVEHTARYAFATRHARGGRALDLGSGAGYGVAEIAARVEVALGIDPSADAVAYAQAHYLRPNAHFLQASAEALPFPDSFFDLVTAFEVIEHVPDWSALVREARRVTHRNGVFLASTPNTLYYAESRAEHGPNPFHTHEFEFAEFRDAMTRYFPHVTLFLQNRQEGFVFVPAFSAEACPDANIHRASPPPEEASFFLALCSIEPRPAPRPFLYLPGAGNLLRERERHIHLLQDELALTKQWLDTLVSEHKLLQDLHVEQTRHLENQNRWALDLEDQLRSAMDRITQLQDEFAADQAAASLVVAQYNQKVAELEQENRDRTEWAVAIEARLTDELHSKSAELAETVLLLDRAESTVIERTTWAQDLQKRIEHLEGQLAMVRQSRWVRLGRVAGLGPQVRD